MANTINQIVTCISKNSIYPNNELNFCFGDTLKCNSPIYFAINLSYLNQLRSNSNVKNITSTDITTNTLSLLVFLCSSIDGNGNFVDASLVTYNLSSANLSNNFLSQSLFGNNKTFYMTHDDFCDDATQEESYKLCREYKIVFRITDTDSPLTTQSLQDGDIVNNFNLMFDTFQQGPYSVSMENIDFLNPEDFTENELLEVYANNGGLVFNENQRVFYPKEINSLNPCPIVLIAHGQGHNPLMYDTYANLFASYGFIVVCITGEIGDDPASTDRSRFLMILRHLKMYSHKIKNGLFENKINFNKIFPIGHSLGASSVSGFIDRIKSNNLYPILDDITLSDIITQTSIEGSVLSTNSDLPVFFISGEDVGFYDGADTLFTAGNTFLSAGVFIKHAAHEDCAFPFGPVNQASTAPVLPTATNGREIRSFITNKTYSYNNRTMKVAVAAERLLQYFSIIFKNKIKNYFYVNNFDYENDYKKENLNTIQFYYREPFNDINFIERYLNTNLFTTDIAGATVVSGETSVVWFNKLPEMFPTKTFTRFTPSYKTINQIFGNSGYLFLYDGSTKGITYDLSGSPLNLSGNSYIAILAGIIGFANITAGAFPVVPNFNTNLYTNFGLELICDGGATSCTINSRQNNTGIMDMDGKVIGRQGFTGNASLLAKPATTTFPFIFWGSDFKNKNPGLTLSNITGLKLHFNPSQGSTAPNGFICLNGIYTGSINLSSTRNYILAFAWSWLYDNASDSATVQNWINSATLFNYVSPMVFITRYQQNDDWKNGVNTADKNAAFARLKGLCSGKRAIQPYSFSYTYWNYLSEGITGVSGSSTMYNDDGTSGVCSGLYANLWATKGLSFGKTAWQQIINEISATGASIDWMLADVESGANLFNSFTVRGVTGLTAAFASNLQFNQSWYGVTSLNDQLLNDGATVSRIHLPPPATDYIVWNKAVNNITTKLLDEVLWKPTLQVFPNVQGSNYLGFNSGSSTDVPRDLNGHPEYGLSKFGSASSPVLYGVIGQLATAWKINPSNTSEIIFGSTTDSNYIIERSPWNSFLLDIKNIRTLRKNDNTTPFTPWIASVKYTGVDQAGVCGSLPPPVGYADVSAGYNFDVGLTFSSPGNSAYYYEMIRHASLYGSKVFGYWNFSSENIGLTQHASLVNDILTEVNSQLGGFTTLVADTSPVSWQTNFFTSGAEKENGDYLWRITVKPGITLLANGITLSSNIGTVGTWVSTTGPTLAGIGLTFI